MVPDFPNLAIMEYNIRSLKHGLDKKGKDTPMSFVFPGYETKEKVHGEKLAAKTHSIDKLMPSDFWDSVDARLILAKSDGDYRMRLDALEHMAFSRMSGNTELQFIEGFIHGMWKHTGFHQQLHPFRDGAEDKVIYKNHDIHNGAFCMVKQGVFTDEKVTNHGLFIEKHTLPLQRLWYEPVAEEMSTVPERNAVRIPANWFSPKNMSQKVCYGAHHGIYIERDDVSDYIFADS